MSKSPNDMANQALDTQNTGERENARDSEQTSWTHPKFLPVVQQAVAQALNQNKHSLPTNNDTITDKLAATSFAVGHIQSYEQAVILCWARPRSREHQLGQRRQTNTRGNGESEQETRQGMSNVQSFTAPCLIAIANNAESGLSRTPQNIPTSSAT